MLVVCVCVCIQIATEIQSRSQFVIRVKEILQRKTKK